MTTIDRIRVGVTTPNGGVGSLSFYSVPGGGHQADVKDFLDDIKDVWAFGTTVEVPNSGEQLNDANGDTVGTWSFGTPATFTSANSGDYAAGVGVRLRWATDDFRNNRHIIGTTYLVPCAVAAYGPGGTIDTTFKSTLETIAASFVTAMSGDLLIWSRPHTGASDGFSSNVTSSSVASRVSWLTSRKL